MERFRVQEAVLALLYPPEERKWADSGYRRRFLCCCTRRKSEKGQMPGTGSDFCAAVPAEEAKTSKCRVQIAVFCLLYPPDEQRTFVSRFPYTLNAMRTHPTVLFTLRRAAHVRQPGITYYER